MADTNRRDFLKTSALIGGGLLAADFVALSRAALAARVSSRRPLNDQ